MDFPEMDFREMDFLEPIPRLGTPTILKDDPGTIKREREDDDEADQKPARKRVTLARKECVVCAEDVAINQFPKLPHAQDAQDEAKHGSDVCFKCYRRHLRDEFKDKEPEAVGCAQCPRLLLQSEIRKLATSRTYREYLDKAAKKCMHEDREEEQFHACPNADCTWGAFFAKDDGNILNCQLCKARYCIVCEAPFHEEQTCEEFQALQHQREEEDKQSLDVVKKTSRPCPGCGANIDKYTGCDHVTCRKCNHEFCWECFAPYRGTGGINRAGNSAHKDTCRKHSNRLPNAPLGAQVRFGG